MVSPKPSLTAVENGVHLFEGYEAAKELNLANLHPWHLVADDEFAGVNNRYQQRSVIPFARRVDGSDVACFVVRDPGRGAGRVIVVHDFASPVHEVVTRMATFWEWFRSAVDDMIEWHEAG